MSTEKKLSEITAADVPSDMLNAVFRHARSGYAKDYKRDLYEKTKARMAGWYSEHGTNLGQRCLYWMHCGVVELAQAGLRPAPCCGSFHFRIADSTTANLQDGFTHLSYQWNGPNNQDRRMAECSATATPLPEMHCWIWLPQTQEVVDFSTGELADACRSLRLPWGRKDTVDFVWGNPADLARNMDAIYIPNRDATDYAVRLLMSGCR